MEVKVINEVKNLAVNENLICVFGNFGIVLQSKVSNYGSGKKTVYTGYFVENVEDVEDGTNFEPIEDSKVYFSNYDITKIQKYVGYISNGSIKTVTDEEISKAVDKKLSKATKAIELLSASGIADEATTNVLKHNLETRKSELLEEYKQKRDERKTSLEKSENAKRLQQLAKEIAEATKKGDFAKVMKLAQQQIALTTEDAEG